MQTSIIKFMRVYSNQDHLLKEGLAWLDSQAAGEPQYWLPALFSELSSRDVTPEEVNQMTPWLKNQCHSTDAITRDIGKQRCLEVKHISVTRGMNIPLCYCSTDFDSTFESKQNKRLL